MPRQAAESRTETCFQEVVLLWSQPLKDPGLCGKWLLISISQVSLPSNGETSCLILARYSMNTFLHWRVTFIILNAIKVFDVYQTSRNPVLVLDAYAATTLISRPLLVTHKIHLPSKNSQYRSAHNASYRINNQYMHISPQSAS
jgi:hypothetical protein